MKITITIILIALYLPACTGEKSETTEEMVFHVDSTKIEALQNFEESGITFHPPKNWIIVNSELSEKLMRSSEVPGDKNLRYIYKPQKIFLEQSLSCLMSVGIVKPSQENQNTDGHLNTYMKLVREKFDGSLLKERSFINNGIKIHQFLIRKSALFASKLVFNFEEKIYQFDYTCPRQYYEEQLNSIESSIGTIESSHKQDR